MIRTYQFKDEREYYIFRRDVFKIFGEDSRPLEQVTPIVNLEIAGKQHPQSDKYNFGGYLDVWQIQNCAIITMHSTPKEKPHMSIIGEEKTIENLVKDYFPSITSVKLLENKEQLVPAS